jgi:hypothetical protein
LAEEKEVVTPADALKILNNNSAGRKYSEREAILLLDFYAKLGTLAAKGFGKYQPKNQHS